MGTSRDAWRGFRGRSWADKIDIGGFRGDNVDPYAGDAQFLARATPRTDRLRRRVQRMPAAEQADLICDLLVADRPLPLRVR